MAISYSSNRFATDASNVFAERAASAVRVAMERESRTVSISIPEPSEVAENLDANRLTQLYAQYIAGGAVGRSPLERIMVDSAEPPDRLRGYTHDWRERSTDEMEVAAAGHIEYVPQNRPRREWATSVQSQTQPRELTPIIREPSPKEKEMVARAYNAYTVGDIKRLKLGFMRKHDTPAEVQDQINYVTMLARSNPVILNARYLELLCEDGDRKQPIFDKPTINRRVFEYMEQFKAPDAGPVLAVIDALSAQYTNDYSQNDVDDLKNDLENRSIRIGEFTDDIQESLQRIDNRKTRIKRQCEIVEQLEQRIEDAEKGDDSEHWVITELRKIVAAGDWTYCGQKGQYFYLISANPIICTHRLPAAGIDQSLDFGRFVLSISCSGELQCYGVENTIDLERGPEHPHINHGSICWGNMYDRISTLQGEKNLIASVQILNQLFREYSPESPYRPYSSYWRRKNRRTTMSVDDLTNSFCPEVATVIHPYHIPFSLETHEQDTSKGPSDVQVGDYVNYNYAAGDWGDREEVRYGTITEVQDSAVILRRIRTGVRGEANRISRERINFIYKPKQGNENDESETETQSEESTGVSPDSRLREGTQLATGSVSTRTVSIPWTSIDDIAESDNTTDVGF